MLRHRIQEFISPSSLLSTHLPKVSIGISLTIRHSDPAIRLPLQPFQIPSSIPLYSFDSIDATCRDSKYCSIEKERRGKSKEIREIRRWPASFDCSCVGGDNRLVRWNRAGILGTDAAAADDVRFNSLLPLLIATTGQLLFPPLGSCRQ